MFGRSKSAISVATEAANSLTPYANQVANDEKLRERLIAAVGAGLTARERARQQAGVVGLLRRLGADPVLRAQLAEMALQLQQARRRVQKNQSHKLRNSVLFLTGVGLVVAAIPSLRERLMSTIGATNSGETARGTGGGHKTVEQEIDVAVPVRNAYNQWTQFEEFPKFMEGVQEVRQLDDTLLHWAATVAGKQAEWDARIVEQEPDRRISWESVDGKETRGAVTFQELGPERTRVRLNMSYVPEGIAEKVGAAAGLDTRRIRGDLERFRHIIESRGQETGAWRGEIKDGETTGTSRPEPTTGS
jgi:uncharacterized membrane protein